MIWGCIPLEWSGSVIGQFHWWAMIWGYIPLEWSGSVISQFYWWAMIWGCIPLEWSGSGSAIWDHSDHVTANESTLDKDSFAYLMHHDPSDLRSLILIQIIPKEGILSVLDLWSLILIQIIPMECAINIFNLIEINDWQVAALVTPSRHPFKNVLDSRANNGTPKRSRYSDLLTRRQIKRKQKSKSLSASLNSLHQLSSCAIKSLQVPSPVREEIEYSKKDVLSPTKLNQLSVEDFVEKVVGRILKEVEKVWI